MVIDTIAKAPMLIEELEMCVYTEEEKESIIKAADAIETVEPERFSPENQELVIQILRAIDYKLAYMQHQAGIFRLR